MEPGVHTEWSGAGHPAGMALPLGLATATGGGLRSFEEVLQAQGGRKRKQPRSPGPKPSAFCPGLRAELVFLVTCFFKSIFSWDQTTVILAA